MIELELQCAQNHKKPIICVLLDNKFIKNEKLLCIECMESYSSNTGFMGFKVALQMIEENQKQKRDFVQSLLDQNYELLNSFNLSLLGLKSSIYKKQILQMKSQNHGFKIQIKLNHIKMPLAFMKNQISQQCMEMIKQMKLIKEQYLIKSKNQIVNGVQSQIINQTNLIYMRMVRNVQQFQKILLFRTQNRIAKFQLKFKIKICQTNISYLRNYFTLQIYENQKQKRLYEGEYQQKNGYVEIENFIQLVLIDESLKKKFQGKDELIETEFKYKWEQYINETNRASEQYYLEMVEIQYKAIKSISTQYILNTIKEQEDEIIKQNPYALQNNDYERIFQLFVQEIQETEQFIVINNKRQNLAYLDIFHQQIQEKLKQSKDQLLDMKSVYSQEINYQVVAKVDIQQYLNYQFEQDFQEFLRKSENQNNTIRYQFFNFMAILDYLQISYYRKFKEQLDNIINTPSFLQNIKQLFTNKNTEAYDTFKDLKKSFKFEYKDNQEIDLTGTKIGQTFKDTYLSLQVINKRYQTWNNTQELKKEL